MQHWGPSYKVDQKKVEQIQRRATRLVTSLRHLPYEDRLEKLELPSLTYRRKRGDMIMVYKTITGRAPGNQFLMWKRWEAEQEGTDSSSRSTMQRRTSDVIVSHSGSLMTGTICQQTL